MTDLRKFSERRAFSFRDDLEPLSGRIISARQKFDGIIENIKIRFWKNTALQLRVRPFIIRLGGGQRHSLIDFHSFPVRTRDFIDGDDETVVFNLKIPYQKDEIIGFIVENIHSTNNYQYQLGWERIIIN